ncbi:BnaA02g35080D [Brassica napus]|uniref:BnaA02g35080D protein n=1 Tax=Brassica napus TaxID=3708 RepID=A0A078ENC9_BRANA|nr:BnaA02g35080D [Brassica napus]
MFVCLNIIFSTKISGTGPQQD